MAVVAREAHGDIALGADVAAHDGEVSKGAHAKADVRDDLQRAGDDGARQAASDVVDLFSHARRAVHEEEDVRGEQAGGDHHVEGRVQQLGVDVDTVGGLLYVCVNGLRVRVGDEEACLGATSL